MASPVNKNALYIDLTHALSSDAPTWSGGCGYSQVIKGDYSVSSEEVQFRVQKVTMHAGIGTHMDAPSHCIPGGLCIHELPLSDFILPAFMIDVSKMSHADFVVPRKLVEEFEATHGAIQAGSIVIFYTGWSQFWNDPKKYRGADEKGITHYPSISEDAALLLLERGVAGVAIDTLSPDGPLSGYPVHRLFLGAQKYIIENAANAEKVPPKGATVVVLPMKMKEATEAPVRMVAIL